MTRARIANMLVSTTIYFLILIISGVGCLTWQSFAVVGLLISLSLVEWAFGLYEGDKDGHERGYKEGVENRNG